MARKSPYPAEMRARAVRMVGEVRPNYDNEYAAIKAVAARLGIGSAETLRKWVRRAEVDPVRPGIITEENEQIKALKPENAELRRANEILKAASAFFAAERIMRQDGLQGTRRGRKIRTTIPGKGPGHERAADLICRDFTAPAPDRRWVADFTHVATLAGTVYVAFVVDRHCSPNPDFAHSVLKIMRICS